MEEQKWFRDIGHKRNSETKGKLLYDGDTLPSTDLIESLVDISSPSLPLSRREGSCKLTPLPGISLFSSPKPTVVFYERLGTTTTIILFLC